MLRRYDQWQFEPILWKVDIQVPDDYEILEISSCFIVRCSDQLFDHYKENIERGRLKLFIARNMWNEHFVPLALKIDKLLRFLRYLYMERFMYIKS